MYIKASTLDDLLRGVYKKLLASNKRAKPSRGVILEETGVLLELKNPRARLSRTESRGKVFSCLGELLWYLAGTNDLEFIGYYILGYKENSEDGKTIYGGYGPRLFNKRGQNQIENVLRLLRANSSSRRAVIQLFDAEDLIPSTNKDGQAVARKEIPCTCTLQLMLRKQRLHMFTHMRSNDAYIGLPHDVFCFTMLQEILARSLNVELGTYKHFVGSLHLYEKDIGGASQYLEEGWQSSTISMPLMPVADPWPAIKVLLTAESDLRGNIIVEIDKLDLDPYWADLVRLLQITRHYKNKNANEIARVKESMSSQIYSAYIEKQQRKHIVAASLTQEQFNLPIAQ